MNTKQRQGILASKILEKMGNGDEFLQEALLESKPSRLQNRRQKEEKHRLKKRRED